MRVERSLIGKAFPSMHTSLTPAAAQQYAAATDDANPFYLSAHAVVPPLAVVIATLPLGVAPIARDPALLAGAGVRKLLHYEEDIRWLRALRIDEPWTVRSRLSDIETHRIGQILRVVTQVETFTGNKLTESETCLFLPGKDPDAPARRSVKPRRTPAAPVWEVTWRVGLDQSERYAAASGDDNPIHLDDAAAQQQGLPQRILHGLCTLAFAQRAVLKNAAGGDPRALRRLRARFSRPVLMGDTLTCTGSRGTEVDFTVRNQRGQIVLGQGFAEVAAKP